MNLSKSIYYFLFKYLLVYYWVWLTFVPKSVTIEAGSIRHILKVGPILLFVLLSFYSVATVRIHKKTKLLLISLLIGALSCVTNGDARAFLRLVVFVVPIYTIYKHDISVNVRFVNKLFFLSVVVAVVSYHIGVNEYGYFPGPTPRENNVQWWRVSLFPFATIPYSAAFSFSVLVLNIICEKGRLVEKLAIVLSLYFIVFSGNRTTYIIILALTFIYLLINLNVTYFTYFVPIFTIVTVYTVLVLPIYLISYDTPEIINYVIYRSPSRPPLSEIINTPRLLLANNLLHIYSTSPLFGVGTFDLYSYFPNAPSHSESKWLSVLTSYGLTVLPIFLFFYKEFINAVRRLNWYGTVFIVSLIIYGAFYGSFINTYNFIFLLLMACSTRSYSKA